MTISVKQHAPEKLIDVRGGVHTAVLLPIRGEHKKLSPISTVEITIRESARVRTSERVVVAGERYRVDRIVPSPISAGFQQLLCSKED